LPDAAEAVKIAMSSDKFPIVLMDSGNNIGEGSSGDSTFILTELLQQKAMGWVITISDREALDTAYRQVWDNTTNFQGALESQCSGLSFNGSGALRFITCTASKLTLLR